MVDDKLKVRYERDGVDKERSLFWENFDDELQSGQCTEKFWQTKVIPAKNKYQKAFASQGKVSNCVFVLFYFLTCSNLFLIFIKRTKGRR